MRIDGNRVEGMSAFMWGWAVVCEERKEREKKERETKRNETKQNETRRNETKRDETKRNETKRNETRRNETKRNETNEHRVGSGHEGSCMRGVSVIDGEVEVVAGDGAEEAPEAACRVDKLEERSEELPLRE
jgi:FtsZ-interacting cell division protein YlmF